MIFFISQRGSSAECIGTTDRAPRLRVPQRDVTSLLPLNFEPGVFENCDNLFRAQTRQSREHIKR